MVFFKCGCARIALRVVAAWPWVGSSAITLIACKRCIVHVSTQLFPLFANDRRQLTYALGPIGGSSGDRTGHHPLQSRSRPQFELQALIYRKRLLIGCLREVNAVSGFVSWSCVTIPMWGGGKLWAKYVRSTEGPGKGRYMFQFECE
jgi:hypothetical protein